MAAEREKVETNSAAAILDHRIKLPASRIGGSVNIEDEKSMAVEGLRNWALALVLQAARIESALKDALQVNLETKDQVRLHNDYMGRFRTDRHFFLIAAWKLIEHLDWARKLNCIGSGISTRIDEVRETVKSLRDMNEHSIAYFREEGRNQADWLYSDREGTSDASATRESKIGGRLDWRELSSAASQLLVTISQLDASIAPSDIAQ